MRTVARLTIALGAILLIVIILNSVLMILGSWEDKIHKLEQELQKMQESISRIQETLQGIESELESWSVYEATAYAPLDPIAEQGMCYEGDPNITASGALVAPGKTIAAGPSIPFGTQLYIKGVGVRVVQDRGGAITDRHLDIAVWTREEALKFGRKYVLARLVN